MYFQIRCISKSNSVKKSFYTFEDIDLRQYHAKLHKNRVKLWEQIKFNSNNNSNSNSNSISNSNNNSDNNNNNNNNFFSNFIILFLRNKSIHTMYRTKHSHSLSKGMRGWTGEVKY